MTYLGVTYALFLLRYALAGHMAFRRQIYFFILFGLFLFTAFRYQVGCDWSGYYNQFQQADIKNWTSIATGNEPIWWTILGFIKQWGLPYPVINIVSSCVFFIGVHVLARRQPDPLGFLVLLFPILIINMPMTAINQGAAIGILCIAFVSFIDRRPAWFIFWLILAVGFHSSAMIFLLLLPLATGRYTRRRLIFAAILAIPSMLFIASTDAAAVATSLYIERERNSNGAVFRLGILGLSSFYFFFFVRKKWMRTFPKDYALVSIGAIGMALSFSLLPISSVISDRFGYYLIPIQTIMFARLPFLPFHVNKGLYSALPYLGLLIVFTVWSRLSWHFQQCYIPYQSWLFGF
jgi:hypothetical protein